MSDSAAVMGAQCPICRETVPDVAYVVLVTGDQMIIPGVDASQLIQDFNRYAAHIVRVHTSGLNDPALNLLTIWLEATNSMDLYDAIRELFGAAK